MQVEARLEERGLVLPEPATLPGIQLSLAWLRVRGNRPYVSGHGRLNPDGFITQPFGNVGELYGPEAGMHARVAPGVTTLPLGLPSR